MKYAPAIDQEQLVRAVSTAYAITATDLTFIPIGFAAACYKLQSASGLYFLKLWPATTTTDTLAGQRAQSLRLTRALYERNIYPRVSYPIPTVTGALSATCAAGAFALFPFLEGAQLPSAWPSSLQDAWAHTFVALHRATAALTDVLPAREQFTLPFVPELQQCLDRLAHIGPNARPGVQAIRDRVRVGQRDIQTQLVRLEQLQQIVRRLDSPFVLCHTDMGGDNMLVDADGQLYILDWDEATVAPPEYDLREARWFGLDRVIRGYRRAGGAAPLHVDHFAFAMLRRALGDMTVRLVRTLTTHTTDTEDADALAEIEEWGFRQWATLDASLEQVAAALADAC